MRWRVYLSVAKARHCTAYTAAGAAQISIETSRLALGAWGANSLYMTLYITSHYMTMSHALCCGRTKITRHRKSFDPGDDTPRFTQRDPPAVFRARATPQRMRRARTIAR